MGKSDTLNPPGRMRVSVSVSVCVYVCVSVSDLFTQIMWLSYEICGVVVAHADRCLKPLIIY